MAAAVVVEVRTASSFAEMRTSPVTSMSESSTVALVVRSSRFHANAAAIVMSGVPGTRTRSPACEVSRLLSVAVTDTATGREEASSAELPAIAAVVSPLMSMRASLPLAMWEVSVVAVTASPPTVRVAPVTRATASS